MNTKDQQDPQYQLTQEDLDVMVHKTNSVMGEVRAEIALRSIPHFGNSMLCYDDLSIIQATIADRILSKFEQPDLSNTELLHEQCMDAWIAYEQGHLTDHNWRDRFQFGAKTRGIIYKARVLLHSWFDGFKTPSFASCDILFPPGETVVSKGGYVSIYQKLRDKDQWCVTHDAAEDFIRLCYNNLSLKRCAKSFFKEMSRQEYDNLYSEHLTAKHIGFAIFRQRMLEEVLTLVHGSRAESVYKNRTKRRFINVEPLGNMILQRLVAARLRDLLKSLGNDLETGQEDHKKLISEFGVSTIDFSNASDSVLKEIVEFIFPSKWFKLLDRYRSPFVLINDVYYMPKKLSSMGNGFTFEVMTLLLLAISRTLDAEARVYGDDVIIDNSVAYDFIRAAECCGFMVNEKKTFVASRFRESCGAFYLDGHGYVTCFDFQWADTPQEAITAINKLFYLAYMTPLSVPLCGMFVEAYERLLPYVPTLLKGPIIEQAGYHLDAYVQTYSYKRSRMRSESIRTLTDYVYTEFKLVLDDMGYSRKDLFLVHTPVWRPKQASPTVVHIVNDPAKVAFYMYSGRRSTDQIRNKGLWEYPLSLVMPSGVAIPINALRDVLEFNYFCKLRIKKKGRKNSTTQPR